MKNLILIVAVLFSFAGIKAQETKAEKPAKTETITIKTSAECDMCKERIEKEVGLTKGVKKATLDLNTRVLTVVYNPKKITPDKLRQVIANAGYDADDVKANNRAQQKLPECCRPGGGKEHK
ncbi:MAG: hypothetical protein Fur0041_12020 [Bacteroidia bacterium]